MSETWPVNYDTEEAQQMTDKATARPLAYRTPSVEIGYVVFSATTYANEEEATTARDLIVRAVNAHGELVQFVRDMADGAYHGGGQWEDEMRNAEDEARALLSRIEGE